MPKLREFEQKIPAFYRKNIIDIMMFTHVNAFICSPEHQKTRYEGGTIEQGIEHFIEFYGLNEDEYPVDSAKVIYNNIKTAFHFQHVKLFKKKL